MSLCQFEKWREAAQNGTSSHFVNQLLNMYIRLLVIVEPGAHFLCLRITSSRHSTKTKLRAPYVMCVHKCVSNNNK